MKNLFTIIISSILLLSFAIVSCEKEDLGTATIYGMVTDKATGEPIKSAGVELLPVGLKTITGADGYFEFTNLKKGNYQIYLTHTNYVGEVSDNIELSVGQSYQCEVQLEPQPYSLRVVDDSRNEISELDFGSAEADITRSINLFNAGTESVEWNITYTADWIKSVSKTEGVLSVGRIQALIITIDRSLLDSGKNITHINIKTDKGDNKQLLVVVLNDVDFSLPTLSTHEIKDFNIQNSSITVVASIYEAGVPEYIERGFVYSTSSKPKIESDSKFVVSGTGIGEFQTDIRVETSKMYYIRSYAINKKGISYGNEIIFDINEMLPKVETMVVEVRNESDILLEGNIQKMGIPKYKECGFLYAKKENITIEDSEVEKVIASRVEGSTFNAEISIELGNDIWYVKAYAINDVGIVYGDALRAVSPSFSEYLNLPSFSFNNQEYKVYATIGEMSYDYAMKRCSELRMGGYTDWVLPTKDELYYMLSNRKEIGDFYSNNYYWSATEYFTSLVEDENAHFAWTVGIDNSYGFESVDYIPKLKEENFYARCIRKN